MENVTKKDMEAAGISKLPLTCLSSVVPWFRNRVPTCANTTENIKLVTQMGSMRTKSFTSSTCVTVHSLQGLLKAKAGGAGDGELPPLLLNFLLLYTGDSFLLV
jgi:hypothetical protein